MTDPAGGVTRYEYDAENRMIRVTDPRGIVMAENTYDENNRVIEQKSADGGTLKFAYTLMNPTVGNSEIIKTVVTDALGRETTYRFSPEGFLTDVTDPLGQTRVFDREGGSNLLLGIEGTGTCQSCGTTAAGDQIYTYDTNGNVLTSIDALGNTTTYTYDPVFNKVASVTDPAGGVAQVTYDDKGNLLTRTDANGHVTTSTYGSFGLLTETTDPLGAKAQFTYDLFGNLASTTDPLGHTTTFAYDIASRLTETTDALGRKTKTLYDNLDRVTAVTDAASQVTTFAFDPAGNLLSVTDARGNTTGFAYDAMNRLKARTDPLGKVETRSYDLAGNLMEYIDRRGQASIYEYDALDRRVKETYQDGAVVTRVYDALGRLVGVTDPVDGDVAMSFDAIGRQTETTNLVGTVEYTFDPVGRVSARTVAGQSALEYDYDPAGNLLRAALPEAAADFAYDARDQVVTLTRSNGVTTGYIYDLAGRVLSITHAKDGLALNTQAYTYDPVGNRSVHTTDIAQPLITQAVSNTYDTANRLLQSTANGMTTSYAYDANGNLSSASNPSGTTTYTLDPRNRLASIFDPSGQTTNFQYDFRGNLIAQTDSGPVRNLSQDFVLDDLTDVAYLSRSNGDSLSVLAGQSIDQHLAVVHPSGQAEYGITDAINSTTATVNQTGKLASTFFYEPFGQTTTPSSYPLQFTGRTPTTESLYYYRARHYDSSVGRFISEDPSAKRSSHNLYSYTLNNPVNFTDPAGLDTNTSLFRRYLCYFKMNICGIDCYSRCKGDPSSEGYCQAWCSDTGIVQCLITGSFPENPNCKDCQDNRQH